MKFKVPNLILSLDGTDKFKATCPFNLLKVGGIKRNHKRSTALERSVKKLLEGLNMFDGFQPQHYFCC